MIAGKRNIRDGKKFDRFFPRANGTDRTVNKNALLSDTIVEMQRVINETLWHTKAIAEHLKADSVRKTCQNIWEFCYHHIQYEKDKRGTEQIRSPRRSWHDRESGIDCDCFTVLIGSILSNLNIPFVMRLWRNREPHFEHVYPVAFTPKGKEVIIDCVIDQFDEQAPYTEIKDVEMELQVLDGVDQERYNEFGDKVFYETDLPMDAEDLGLDADVIDLEGVDGLRDWLKRTKEKRQERKTERKEERQERKTERKEKRAEKRAVPLKDRVKQKVQNFGRKLNKVNPVTSLMRAGILASMKLNVMGVASKIRFAYWTPQQARRANMDMLKYNQIQELRTKIEGIYRKLGGDIKSLRKTILTGKGNRNQMVALNGLNTDTNGWGTITISSDSSTIRSVLGDEVIYDDLHDSGILESGVNGLGSISLSAAIAAAAGFIGKIAGMFKKIGGIFRKGSKQESQLQIQQNTEAQEEKTNKFSAKRILDLVHRTRAAQQINQNNSVQANSALPVDFQDEMFDTSSYDTASDYGTSNYDDAGGYDKSGYDDYAARDTRGGLEEQSDDMSQIDTSLFDSQSDGTAAKDDSSKETPWYKNPWIIGGTVVLGLGVASYFIFKPKGSKSVNGVSGVSKTKKKVRAKSASKGKAAGSVAKTRKKSSSKKTRKPTLQRAELQA